MKQFPKSALTAITSMALLLASCATSGPAQKAGGPDPFLSTASFAAGAELYALARTAPLEPLLQPVLSALRLDSDSVRLILKRTHTARLSLFPAASAEPFAGALEGRAYPAFFANISFGLNKDWKKERSGGRPFWVSKRYNTALGISAGVIAFAKSNPYFYQQKLDAPPLPAWLSGAFAVCWSPRAVLLNNYLKQRSIAVKFPANALYIALFPAAAAPAAPAATAAPAAPAQGPALAYRLVLCVEAENAARAASIQSLIKLTKSALEEGVFERQALPELVKLVLRSETSVEGANVFMYTEDIPQERLVQMLAGISAALK